MRRIIAVAVAAVALATLPASSASADTERCVSAGEYDRLQQFTTLAQVRELFDIDGRPEANSPDGDFYRLSFNGCAWTGENRVWTAFSYNGYGLDHWSVH